MAPASLTVQDAGTGQGRWVARELLLLLLLLHRSGLAEAQTCACYPPKLRQLSWRHRRRNGREPRRLRHLPRRQVRAQLVPFRCQRVRARARMCLPPLFPP